MPRTRQPGWPLLVMLLLLLAGACAYTLWKKQQAAGDTLEQTADLVSDNRLIFGGAPRPASGAGDEVAFEVLRNTGYIAGYSESRRDPLWVSYRVFHVAQPNNLPRPPEFSPDPRTTARVKSSDFTRSGYDRGHMCPNEDIMRDYGRDAQLETFLLSNICPQAPELNEHVWERLEVAERRYAEDDGEVWVIDGPVFADLSGGHTPRLASGIAVPSAFYKILVENRPVGGVRVFSVIMPQDVKGTEPPQQYVTSVAEIEKETHLDFLWKLDAATRGELEQKTWKMW